jgi:lysophospholipase L1-like esterase
MKIFRWILFMVGASVASLITAAEAPASPKTLTGNPATIPATDARFLLEGRFDRTDPAGPVVIWQGSRVSIDFEGDSIALQFGEVKRQNFFDADCDGRLSLVELREGQPDRGVMLSNLGQGRHHLHLFKRNEAAAGTVRFRGIILPPGGQAFAPIPPKYRVAFQFFGDSITAGACSEDGATDQWEDFRTHNNAKSYGAFTANAFQADYRNIAVSGMGIVTGWVPMKAGEIWDRVYPVSTSAAADLTAWTPQVVFINLGENDDSFTKAKEQPFPAAAFTGGYVSLVRAIRAAYPQAEIVILRGGMFGGAQSLRLRTPWEAAVTQLEGADAHLTHFVFGHWSSNHPRVFDHQAMADELVEWLKQQPFMRPYR